ncbi:MAG TPA: hypothetical protein VM680_18535 [Verrucomicrobiae bacterium]|nr:hypothetical protein [Verrucomicrobiae bacterium]
MLKGSWKTTVSGIGAIATAIGLLCAAVTADKLELDKVMGAIMGMAAGAGLLAARDNKVTSEEVGAGTSGTGATGGTSGTDWAQRVPAIVFLLFIVSLGSGCAVLDKAASAVTRSRVSVVTNVVERVVTNVVSIPIRVPGPVSNVFITNFVDRVSVVTNVAPERVTNEVFEVKPGISAGINVARAGSALAPPPYGTVASGVLAALSAGLGFLAARKNKQAALAKEEWGKAEYLAARTKEQLKAVIVGVEEATKALDPVAGNTVKGLIAKTSKVLGVARELDNAVQTITKA